MTIPIPKTYLVVCLVAACSSEPDAKPPTATSSASSHASAEATPRTFGASWDRAASSGDEADLARLALDEGAAGLVEALSDPVHGAVAMRALPHAPDRDVAIAPLAAKVHAGAADAEGAADALVALLAFPSRDRERLDPDGEKLAARELLVVAKDEARAASLRAKAVTALRRLAERGVVARAEIPPAPGEP
jgi:hypothetical protein